MASQEEPGESRVMFKRMAKPRLGFLRPIFSHELAAYVSVRVRIVGVEAQERFE